MGKRLPRMDTDQLLAFQCAVREGSFSRAAVALGVGQPAVSARIQALEAAVGGALFVRGRRVSLTPLGEGFLAHAARALEILDVGVGDARLVSAGERGRVSLAVLGSLAANLVGPALAELLAAHPGVACAMRSGDNEQTIALLLDGVVELAIALWPFPAAAAGSVTPLARMREPVILVAGPRHPLASLRVIRRADVVRTGRPLLLLRWWRAHHPEIVRLAEQTGTSVEVPMAIAQRLVLEHRAVGFFPRTLVADDLARGALRALSLADLAPLHRDLALVRRRRPAPLPAAASHLVDVITGEARRLGLLDARRRPPRSPAGR